MSVGAPMNRIKLDLDIGGGAGDGRADLESLDCYPLHSVRVGRGPRGRAPPSGLSPGFLGGRWLGDVGGWDRGACWQGRAGRGCSAGGACSRVGRGRGHHLGDKEELPLENDWRGFALAVGSGEGMRIRGQDMVM